MSRRIFFTLLSILVSLPLLFSVTKVFAQTNYGVSGFVCDDLNLNKICEPNEPGIPGMMVYADNTHTVYKAYTDAYGHWQIPTLPPGAHSIEIQNAGAGGSRPTTSEKFLVSGPTSNVQFGIQKGGYSVDGRVIVDGRPVAGTTVYVDSSNRTAVTDGSGYYRFEDIGYDNSTPVYGVSGGHNIIVPGYSNTNPILVNPSASGPPVQGIRADFNVTTDQGGSACPQVITRARNPITNVCIDFPTPCDVPAGWPLGCSTTQPGGQCTQGESAGTTSHCLAGTNQYCSFNLYRNSNCSTYEGNAFGCYVASQCGSTSQPSGQCTQGQRVPGSGTQTCNYQTRQRCMVYSYYSSSSCSSTYQGGLEECQYVVGYCNYGQSGYTYGNDGVSTLQGEQSVQPVQTYDPAPASWVDNSWQNQPTYADPYYQQTWYDQSTPYIAPDWYY